MPASLLTTNPMAVVIGLVILLGLLVAFGPALIVVPMGVLLIVGGAFLGGTTHRTLLKLAGLALIVLGGAAVFWGFSGAKQYATRRHEADLAKERARCAADVNCLAGLLREVERQKRGGSN